MKSTFPIFALVLLVDSTLLGQIYHKYSPTTGSGGKVGKLVVHGYSTGNCGLLGKSEVQDTNLYPGSESLSKAEKPKIYLIENSEETTVGNDGNSFQTTAEIIIGVSTGKAKVLGNKSRHSDSSYGARIIYGYNLVNRISVGLGVGVDNYKDALMCPVTLDFRFALTKTKFCPMLNFNSGYSVNVTNGGGAFITNPSIGFRTKITNTSTFIMNAGVRALVSPIFNVSGSEKESVYQFYTLSAGFNF